MINTKNNVSAVIVSAGNSERMRGCNKQLLEINGHTVIGMSMRAFEECEDIAEIIVVAREQDIETFRKIAESENITKLKAFANGGNSRQESVANGIKEVSYETELIAIHDGARPLVTQKIISETIKNASVFGGSAPAVPVKDTIKTVSDNLVTDTPPRQFLYAVQTPQVFKKEVYYNGLEFVQKYNIDCTDDCQIIEAVSGKIYITDGDYTNIKITTPEDIEIAKILVAGKERG